MPLQPFSLSFQEQVLLEMKKKPNREEINCMRELKDEAEKGEVDYWLGSRGKMITILQ